MHSWIEEIFGKMTALATEENVSRAVHSSLIQPLSLSIDVTPSVKYFLTISFYKAKYHGIIQSWE